MGQYYEQIPESLIQWILDQKMFWVSTAPLSGDGHVNVSPKGGTDFGLANGNKSFWYMDMTGSGNETVSHLYENGRITVMFNAFEGAPRILRLYGRGRVIEGETADYADYAARHNVRTLPGSRSIVVVDIHQVGTSCGFAVPYYDFKEFRPTLYEYFERKQKRFDAGNEKESMPKYWALKNAWSVDGLPGMKIGLKTGQEESIVPLKKMVGDAAPREYKKPVDGFSLNQLLLAVILSTLITAFSVLYGVQLTRGAVSLPLNVSEFSSNF